jgi:hypothetical protein
VSGQSLIEENTMEDFSQRIANLSPQKRALLERRLRNWSASGANSRAISRRGVSDPCPLSFRNSGCDFWTS